VPADHPFWRHIEAFTQLYHERLLASPRMYCPRNPYTWRDGVFIERALGNFSPPLAIGMFTDLPYPGLASFTPFIEQFYNDGITMGCSQSLLMYCPQNYVTRVNGCLYRARIG